MTLDIKQDANSLQAQLNQVQADVAVALNLEKHQISINKNSTDLQKLFKDLEIQIDIDTEESGENTALKNSLSFMKTRLKQEFENNTALITKINLLALEEKENIEKYALLFKKNNELKENNEALSKCAQEVDNLKRENKELLYRQSTLDNEIVKAEIQIELIKDVVLREKAF